MSRRALPILVAAVLLPLSPAFAPEPETIAIDAKAPARPFPHFWELMFGSGRANLSLRESYRRDLDAVRFATGIQYVRFHAILGDENGIYDEDAQGRPVYNFSYLDQIYDGLLERNIRPFVELSFMPRKLASSLTPHPFWYKPFVSPPNNYAHWDDLIARFTRHLVERYGEPEVEQWYFEVWNEPNIDFWAGSPKEATYYELYDHTARAIKSVSPHLRVGGPSTAGNYFTVLGVRAALGRALSAVGKVLNVNGTIFTVVGVTPLEFFGESVESGLADFWLPITLQPQVMQAEPALKIADCQLDQPHTKARKFFGQARKPEKMFREMW